MPLDLTKIIQHNLPETCYNAVEVKKNQIVIHHTAGNSNPIITIDGWKTRTDKVCTAFVIGGKPKAGVNIWKDGDIYQAFSSKFWGNHLGLAEHHFAPLGIPYKQLNDKAIAIEICNWGCLTKDASGKYKNYLMGDVPAEEVAILETTYRGTLYYHKYTDAQLLALRDLLIYLCDKYNIPKIYHANMFDVNKDAMSGANGIWTHTSYRTDKSDCSPQKKLIDLLQTLDHVSI